MSNSGTEIPRRNIPRYFATTRPSYSSSSTSTAASFTTIRDALMARSSMPDIGLEMTRERRVERALQRTASTDLPPDLRHSANNLLSVSLGSLGSINWEQIASHCGLSYEEQVPVPIEILAFVLVTKSGRQCLAAWPEMARASAVVNLTRAVFRLSILPFRHSMTTLLLPALGVALKHHHLEADRLRESLALALQPWSSSWAAYTLTTRLDDYTTFPPNASLATIIQIMKIFGEASLDHEQQLVAYQAVAKTFRAFHVLCSAGNQLAVVLHGTAMLEWIVHLTRVTPDLLQPVIEENDFVADMHVYLIQCASQTALPHDGIVPMVRSLLERIRLQLSSDSVQARTLVARADDLMMNCEANTILQILGDFIRKLKKEYSETNRKLELEFEGFSFEW